MILSLVKDETIRELIHAQLLCGCANDKAQRAMNQKPVDVGVNLLLELMLSPKKKIAKTGPLYSGVADFLYL